MKNQFLILTMACTILAFFSCKNKKLDDAEFSKLMLSVSDSISAISVQNDIKTTSVVEVRTNSNKRMNTNENNTNLVTASFECDGSSIQYSYESIIGPIAHSVTGGNPPISFRSDNNIQMPDPNGLRNCAIIGDLTNVEVMLEIKIPCNKIDSISDMTLIAKLFENSTAVDSAMSIFLIGNESFGLNSQNIGKHEVLSPANIIQKKHFVNCGSSGNCVIHVYISVRVTPRININGTPRDYTFAFQIRDQNAIVHTHNGGVTHNLDSNLSNFITLINNTSQVKSISKKGWQISPNQYSTWYNQTCDKIPVSLADFRNCDSPICNHMAEHTYLVQLPVCSISAPSSNAVNETQK